ncbi:MAG TPA: hypothetical protein VMN99_15525 [Anaerolineales bacterium]|nr:hypothetical protein [Anaerolineales bacterium]
MKNTKVKSGEARTKWRDLLDQVLTGKEEEWKHNPNVARSWDDVDTELDQSK